MAEFFKGAFIGMIAGAAISMAIVPPSPRRVSLLKRKAGRMLRSASSVLDDIMELRA